MDTIITTAVLVAIAYVLSRSSYKCGYADAERRFNSSELPKCTCEDVNQCETWCHAKAMLAKDTSYSIEEVCPHHVVELKVICTAGTCETTVEQCDNCKKTLTEPKTEC